MVKVNMGSPILTAKEIPVVAETEQVINAPITVDGKEYHMEQIRTLDKHRLRERAGQITPEDQKRVDQALDVSLGLTSY